MEDVIRAPSPGNLLAESRGVLELPRLFTRFPALAQQPRGRGERVLVLPGYSANDASTAVLRGYIGFLGYRPRGWGFGRNNGDVPSLIPRVVELVERLADKEGEPIRVVGWSLGGYLAREAAREKPSAIRQVVTLGSPVVGGPKYTAVAEAFRRRGIDLDEIEAQVDARNRRPLETPVTAVYSRNDGVVAWQACIDPYAGTNVEHVEVEATHLGLGFSADVFEIIARRLAIEDFEEEG